jgi:hypothetical protein
MVYPPSWGTFHALVQAKQVPVFREKRRKNRLDVCGKACGNFLQASNSYKER